MAEAKKILVIEDDKFLSMVLKGRLEHEGFVVSQALDGEEGLKMIRSIPPDLILLDLIIPKISGFEVLETMHADPQLEKIPVVVASNLGQDSDIQKAKSLGALDYYVKATTPVDDIAGMVKKVLGVEDTPQVQEQIPSQDQPAAAPSMPQYVEPQVPEVAQVPSEMPPQMPAEPQAILENQSPVEVQQPIQPEVQPAQTEVQVTQPEVQPIQPPEQIPPENPPSQTQ